MYDPNSTQPIRLLDLASKSAIINRYAKPTSVEILNYATVRDFCDSADHLPQICNLNGDLKNVQRPWIIKTILRQVPIGGKLLEIGGGIPDVSGILVELGYDVTIVDPYEGAGNGPTEYEKYRRQFPNVKIIRSLFGTNFQGATPASFDCIFSVSVLEHIWPQIQPDIFAGIRKFLRPRGKSIHCIDHVLQGAGAEAHDANLKVILFHQLSLQKPNYQNSQFEPDYQQMINQLKDDLETYYLSAEGHHFWRGGFSPNYDDFPFRKVVSIQSCVSLNI